MSKKKLFYFMQLYSADPKIVLRIFKMFVLTTKSWKSHPQKLLRIPQIHFFSLTALTALTAQTAQTEEFMIQNVAYWPTVYRTGAQAEWCSDFHFKRSNFGRQTTSVHHKLDFLKLFFRGDIKKTTQKFTSPAAKS